MSIVAAPRRGAFSAFNVAFTLLFLGLCGLSMGLVLRELFEKTGDELVSFNQRLARHFGEALRLSQENLHSVSGLVVFVDDISLRQFRDLTARNFEVDRGLLLVEWQPVVSGDQRERFEREARDLGLADFRLWEPDASGNPIAARPRREHVPVYLMRSRELAGDSLSTLGLDLAWSPLRMQSKWEARDTGRARASTLFEVITSNATTSRPIGFAITLPVYREGFVPTDMDTRRERLSGYLAGVYALEDVLRADLDDALAMGLNVDIHDAGAAHDGEAVRLERTAGPASTFEDEMEFDLYGSRLHLRLIATDRFVNEQFEALWLTLPGAVLLIGLLTLYFLRRLEIENERLVAAQAQLQTLNQKLRDLSDTDPLTGLYNRRAIEERIGQELDRLARHGGETSLLLVDIDHFKAVNDKWGHNSGDEVLAEFARICGRGTRNFDMVARWGGEEFAILLAHAGPSEAARFAERLRRQVEGTTFPVADLQAEVKLTVSIGLRGPSSPVGRKGARRVTRSCT